ncbi:MAG: ABC transporter ATP-binding protein, partial [Clostridiales bacterium]|nr:ABC transporter ATP-binding protein [Clostridiales bacterium]
QVQVNGVDCTRMHEKKRAQLLSFLPQTPSLAGGRTTLDAVLMGYNAQLGLFDSPSAAQRQNALAILGRFGLADRADVDFGTLSQGQKQLVLLARSMVQEAPVMLMDEPDSALDFTNRHHMLRLIRDSIHSQQRCGLITLHDPNFAMAYCDRLVLLHGGVIQAQITMASASAEELREQLSLLYGPVEVLSYGGRFFMVEKADL